MWPSTTSSADPPRNPVGHSSRGVAVRHRSRVAAVVAHARVCSRGGVGAEVGGYGREGHGGEADALLREDGVAS